jgi:hypothetical protein
MSELIESVNTSDKLSNQELATDLSDKVVEKVSENLTEITVVSKVAEVTEVSDSVSDLVSSITKLDINEKSKQVILDYSNILYYSLIFDEETYWKILGIIVSKTEVQGVFKMETKDKIANMLDRLKAQMISLSDESGLENLNQKQMDLTAQNKLMSDYEKIINKLNQNENFIIHNKDKILYKLNDKFHTTLLYTGGKEDPKALEVEPFLDTDLEVELKTIGISDNFVVCGIEILNKAFPYYGNPIQHITIGLKVESNKFKILPKDSPTAFEKGLVITLKTPLTITGKIVKECKK